MIEVKGSRIVNWCSTCQDFVTEDTLWEYEWTGCWQYTYFFEHTRYRVLKEIRIYHTCLCGSTQVGGR